MKPFYDVDVERFASERYCIEWKLADDARYHIWLANPIAPVERAIGCKHRTLYKHPDSKHVLKLNAESPGNADMIELVIDHAKKLGLFARADRAFADKQAAEQRAREQAIADKRIADAAPQMLDALMCLVAATKADGWPLGWGMVQDKLNEALLAAGCFAQAYPIKSPQLQALDRDLHRDNVEETLDQNEDREGDYR